MSPLRAGELRDVVIEALGDQAVPLGMLRERLGQPWLGRAGVRDDLDRLLQSDTAFTELTDGIAFVPALLEGSSWTVWIDPDDAADGFVRMHPALSALGWWLINDDVELVDGEGAKLGVLVIDGWMLDGRDTDVVLGPDRWLDGLAGGWAAVHVVGGALRWSRLDAPPQPTAQQVAAVRSGFDRAVRLATEQRRDSEVLGLTPELRFSSGAGPVHEAMLLDRAAFRDDPVPPLTELYAAVGLVLHNSLIAEEGFDWDALHTWQVRNLLRISYGLDDGQADAVAAFRSAFLVWRAADDGIDIADIADAVDAPVGALDDGHVAAAVWPELRRAGATPTDLARFVATWPIDDRRSIGLVWLQARLDDRTGNAAAAVDALEAIIDSGGEHVPALIDLAGFRADRGDAVGARRLLIQAGVELGDTDDDDYDGDVERDEAELLLAEVEGFATHRPRPTARRNDPCPCGSGRKYKVCHLGRETHSLDDRAGWLYSKAQRFLRDRYPDLVDDLIEQIVVDEFDQHELFAALADSPFVVDIALHEDDVFAEFVAARDALLPDDEALLAAQWALVDRGVFEIIATHESSIVLRDVAGGEQIHVVNTHPSDRTRPGMLIIGRPLPVGDTFRAFSGFINVPHGHLDRTLAAIDSGDSEAITTVLRAMFAPPRLSNTDGHDLVARTITWHIAEPSTLDDALVAAGLQRAGHHRWTLVRDSKNQHDTVIASVRLDDGVLVAETNSTERAAEVEAIITAAVPTAELVGDESRPFATPIDDVSDDELDDGFADTNDPAIRALLEAHIAEYERRWLDEPIPALHGRTPRQAAADPIGREELLRLLASFPAPSGDEPGLMNPDRIRAELNL
jgi:hypothetical protein